MGNDNSLRYTRLTSGIFTAHIPLHQMRRSNGQRPSNPRFAEQNRILIMVLSNCYSRHARQRH